MSKTVDLHQVDAFASAIFGGNPAGVVTNAESLSDEQMGLIAREMNLSETAFVVPASSKDADVKVRYFTPTSEIAFCGHATIGTLFELSRLNMFGLGEQGRNTARVETGAGVLEMSVTCEGTSEPKITFSAPPVDMQTYRLQGADFAKAFGMPAEALANDVLVDTKLNYVYIPVASLKQLGELSFDQDKMRKEFAADKPVVFCLFAAETFDKTASLHARVTCPFIGILEDPFTGSTQSGLIHTAKQLGMLDTDKTTIVVEQGNFMERPGFATVEHDITADTIKVNATAAQVFSTTLELK